MLEAALALAEGPSELSAYFDPHFEAARARRELEGLAKGDGPASGAGPAR